MSSADRTSPLPPALLLSAARRVLRPLVHLMMRNGITFPVLSDALRSLFVEVAVTEVLAEPKARTDSRISLLTGVHRKEIRRLRELPPDAGATPDIVTLASQIVARWVGTPGFLDAAGKPCRLPRGRAANDAPSFEALVEGVTTDVRPRAVLDDLLEQGIVVLDSDDTVQLNAAAFIPRPGGEEQVFYFARNLHDHIAAAVANISAADAAPFLDRSVHYDGLTEEQARALHEYARTAAIQALLDVNRHALNLVEGTQAPAAASRRVNFGIYILHEPERPAASGVP